MLPWFGPDRFPLYLAPMAGFTDRAFRGLARREGADVVVTEFVRAEALLSGAAKVWAKVDFDEGQRPMGVQLFGSAPDKIAAAARLVVDRLGPDFIDLNFGCPADPVTDDGAGSSCLLDLPRLGRIVEATVRAVAPVPVTAKMRLGWDDAQRVHREAARIAEESGAQAIAVHGRTKAQGYSGRADWDAIEEVARERRVPVIGNGDVASAADVVAARARGAVSGVMIGRAALGYPWLFREIKAWMATGEKPAPPSVDERWDTILAYARELLDTQPWAGDPGIGALRSRLKSLTKDLPAARALRADLDACPDWPSLVALSERHRAHAREIARAG